MDNKYSQNKRCEKCGRRITDNIAWMSLRMFGFELCWDDQSVYKLRKFKEELAKEDISTDENAVGEGPVF